LLPGFGIGFVLLPYADSLTVIVVLSSKKKKIKNWNWPHAGWLHHCICKNRSEAGRLHFF